MNLVFVLLFAAALVAAVIARDVKAVGQGALDGAGAAVTLAIGLIGAMALWLGLLKIAERVGLVEKLSRAARPVFRPLFGEVPDGHPAISAMLLNIAANMLGLGNAATPFGIKAMEQLETLNPTPGTATNAQALFLAINTASLQLVPTTVIAMRASAHSKDPAGILLPTLAATACALTVAILVAKLSERARPGAWIVVLAGLVGFVLLLAGAAARWRSAMEKGSSWALALILVGIPLYGYVRRVKVYEAFVEGAKDGFNVGVRIIPYLVAILAGVGAFRASGAMDAVAHVLGPYTTAWGLPPEVIPVAIVRPLSGGGSLGIVGSIFATAGLGPDSYAGKLASILQGSTETTFYVLSVYCGAVGIVRYRHALAAGLSADATGLVASVVIARLLWG
jgi:spore maturation protein SpmA